jgi:hypothetical protein
MLAPTALAVTDDQATEMVYWHNKARSEIAMDGKCANMLEMVWDADVASAAQSNPCPTTHNGIAEDSYGAYIGENLAWSSGGSCTTGMCEEAGICDPATSCESSGTCSGAYCTLENRIYSTDGWYLGEVDNNLDCLSFNDGGGHCSQVVWQSSEYLGCDYAADCSGSWSTTLNCNYYPPGNFNIPDYNTAYIGACTQGTACSACPSTHPFCTGGDNPGLCSRTEDTTTDVTTDTTDVTTDTTDVTDGGNTTDPIVDGGVALTPALIISSIATLTLL